jgi:hypothetical protein
MRKTITATSTAMAPYGIKNEALRVRREDGSSITPLEAVSLASLSMKFPSSAMLARLGYCRLRIHCSL